MNYRDAQRLLQQVIADIDAGRLAVVPPPRTIRRTVGSSLMVAALGMGVGACDSATTPTADTAEPPVQDTAGTAVAVYAVDPPPTAEPQPTVVPSAEAYGVPAPRSQNAAPPRARPVRDGGAEDAGKPTAVRWW